MESLVIATPDGQCPAYLFRPAGAGPWPVVLMLMDGMGIRPALFAMAERIAAHGYLTLLPDLFYRSGPYAPMNAKTVFTDPVQRKELAERFFVHATAANFMRDVGAFLAFLAQHPDARPGPVGVTGYCMGGRTALSAAGTFPERIAAIAAFHPGRMATDKPDSPHLLAPRVRARVHICGARDDKDFDDAEKARLVTALQDGGVAFTLETANALHGWVPADTLVHDAAEAERHYATLFALLDGTMGRAAA
ncbi:MAG: dienelactone hydrolase family protein [Gemmatimonadetes bacterium]|nr:dienelactone hydrolase family protein [Gemmatimonadota bacterium]